MIGTIVRVPILAEAVSNQKIVVAVESTLIKENVVPRKTVVYETLV